MLGAMVKSDRKKIRSASGRTAALNDKPLNEISREAEESLDQLMEAIRETESLIDAIREALTVSQPPRNGMLGLRWWVNVSTSRLMNPVLVRWIRRPGRKAWPEPVKRITVSREGTAALNADHTERLAQMAKSLIELRRDLLDRVRRVIQLRHYLNGVFLRLTNERVIVESIRQDCLRRLVEAGYEVSCD